MTTLLWLRLDLRLEDNPALHAASTRGPVVPVFVYDPAEEAEAAPGAASRWWLHQSLGALARTLERLGSRLILRQGPTQAALEALCRETGATAVFWNRRYEPAIVKRDAAIRSALGRMGVATETFNVGLLFEPDELQTSSGGPYTVFTPFWRACMARPTPARPQPAPERLTAPGRWPEGLDLAALELLPRIDWAAGLRESWSPGEAGARKRLNEFVDNGLERYGTARDQPGVEGVSRLSPHLHFGEISPRAVFHAAREAGFGGSSDVEHFARELGWREFAHHLLWHFPYTVHDPLNPAFESFPWAEDERALQAWQKGRTGYPLVDAGMRELWHTGFMHNRVRMVVASFLVKHLLLPWQRGAAWFWDTLVDADLANNTLGWQWTAGCGADAAPFFRIFNPVLQGRKFDPRGAYVRRWVPELARLPDDHLHEPWRAPGRVLDEAGVDLGKTYPLPIVDHAFARQRALAALNEMKAARPAAKGGPR